MSSKPSTWRTWTNVAVAVIAVLLVPHIKVPVPAELLARSGPPIPPLPSTSLFNTGTMEQVTHWWQQQARPAYWMWHSALMDTLHDSSKAAYSWSRLCYFTAVPVLRLLYYFLTVILLQTVLYDFLLVQGLHWSPHVWRQMQKAGRAFWRWQWSRTPQQVLLEVAVLFACGGLYQLHRRGYFSRFQRAVAYRGRQVQQVRLIFCRPTGI
jgi:hypothetical protein